MEKCLYCENYHSGICPRIKTIEYYENGSTKKVEFHDTRPQNDSYPRILKSIEEEFNFGPGGTPCHEDENYRFGPGD